MLMIILKLIRWSIVCFNDLEIDNEDIDIIIYLVNYFTLLISNSF